MASAPPVVSPPVSPVGVPGATEVGLGDAAAAVALRAAAQGSTGAAHDESGETEAGEARFEMGKNGGMIIVSGELFLVVNYIVLCIGSEARFGRWVMMG